jgi:hypothetical protein
MTYNAAAWLVDRHVEAGDGDRLAVVCGEDHLSYADLQRRVWRAQNALTTLGIGRTERIVLVTTSPTGWPGPWARCARGRAGPPVDHAPARARPVVADAAARWSHRPATPSGRHGGARRRRLGRLR